MYARLSGEAISFCISSCTASLAFPQKEQDGPAGCLRRYQANNPRREPQGSASELVTSSLRTRSPCSSKVSQTPTHSWQIYARGCSPGEAISLLSAPWAFRQNEQRRVSWEIVRLIAYSSAPVAPVEACPVRDGRLICSAQRATP